MLHYSNKPLFENSNLYTCKHCCDTKHPIKFNNPNKKSKTSLRRDFSAQTPDTISEHSKYKT